MTKRIIHIGFPKTGTTYLQTYFDSHPNIYHNRSRFERYYKTGTIDGSVLCETNDAKFDVLSEELLSIWPGKTDDEILQKHNLNYDIRVHQKKVAKDLHKLFPNATILITVRNYPSLIVALYSQYLFGGGYKSLNDFVKVSQDTIIELYNYDYAIKLYRELFGYDAVLVLPFEFLSANPFDYIQHIEKKINFKQLDFTSKKIHPSLNSFSIPIIRILNFVVINYMKRFYKKNKKQKYLSYLEWLNRFKNKLSNLKIGKTVSINESLLKNKQFKENSTLIKFNDELEPFNSFY